VAQVILELDNSLLENSGGSFLEPKPNPPDGFCWIWAILGSLGYLEDSTRDTEVPSRLDWARGMRLLDETTRNAATYKEKNSFHDSQLQVSPFHFSCTSHLTLHFSLQRVEMPVYTSNGRFVKYGTFGGETLIAAVASMLGVNVLVVATRILNLSNVETRVNAIVLIDVEKNLFMQLPQERNCNLVDLSNFIKEGRFCVVLRLENKHFEHCGTLGTPVQTCLFEPYGVDSHAC
jgi:hypothetical protein